MADESIPITISDIAGHPMHLRSMSGDESLGGQPEIRPFEYRLELLSPDTGIQLRDVLGQKATIKLELPEKHFRYFNGHVASFKYTGMLDSFAVYQATLRPWLWFLNFTSDCRVFPNMTVREIVRSIFSKYGHEVLEKVSLEYPAHEHVVQYRETDLNFVTRLLEQAGIHFFCTHEDGKHTLVLADGISAHGKVSGYQELRYRPPTRNENAHGHHFDTWQVFQDIKPNAYVLGGFDFENPRADLLGRRQSPQDEDRFSMGELFDFPSEHRKLSRGEELSSLRLDEFYRDSQSIEVEGNTWGIGVGHIFTLTNPPRADKPVEFLVTTAHYEIRLPDPVSGNGGGTGEPFRARYGLVPSTEPFRPKRITPKPAILGPQTAIVIGMKKTAEAEPEEIVTDRYGRVRVRFHWERVGANRPQIRGDQDLVEEDNTCWVRVAQAWAGNRWGSLHVPRVGQEVVVEFLEGDPDRPLVTGSVYNGDNMPPYEKKTQSGIKSRSTKGGNASNFNEIRFDDDKGHEELHVQAERDMTTLVKHDQTTTVDVNRTVIVGADQAVKVHGKLTTRVRKDEERFVHGSQSTTVDLDRKLIVTGASKTEIAKKAVLTFGEDRETKVTGTDEKTVGKGVLNQGGSKLECAEGNIDLKTEGWLKITHAGAKVHIDDEGNVSIQTDKEIRLHATGASATFADGKAEISAEKEATIAVGNNTIKVDATGVTTTANNITSSASTMHQMTAPVITQN
jgi:type VI secretion system secreted protein VgrG